jgi:hypothetical protein
MSSRGSSESAGRALAEIDVVGFPADTADQAVPLSRRDGREHVIMTRWHECLDVAAAAVRADGGFGGHNASSSRRCYQSDARV